VKVLITGATGFVGSWLVEYLLSLKTVKVFGIKQRRSSMENVRHLTEEVEFFECDLRDATSVLEVIERVKPNYIFHLAAQSFVPTSWNAPRGTIDTNVMGTINLLEAVRKIKITPVIHIAGSSEEYGFVKKDELPIKEDNPLRPLSPYGVSKVAQNMLGYQYYRSYGLKIIRTRAFNHTGPRRPPYFVCSNFAYQVAKIEKGNSSPVIRVGNLEAIRDFTDVRDIVRAYWLVANKGEVGEVYNICSGEGRKVKDVLTTLLKLSKRKDIKVELDKRRLRPSDVPILVGDCSKFKRITNWERGIKFETTLKDLLNYWRKRV
jgi:GDP-4-dehydro-6-deoxy-D-mannose reductase